MNPAQIPQRPFALLVTHAALGSELIRTVEAILGAQSDVLVLSNDGYSSDALSRAIEERVRAVPGERPVVLFTDLAAGSCGIASRRADLYLFAAPEGARASALSVSEALLPSTLATIESERSFLLFPGPEEPLRLKEGGFPLAEVNVGGLHHAPGKIEVLPYVHVSPMEREALLALERLGVRVTAQDLPTNPARRLAPLLGEAA